MLDRTDSFDLVLSEAHMPDMNVFRLTELVGLKMYVPVAGKCNSISSCCIDY